MRKRKVSQMHTAELYLRVPQGTVMCSHEPRELAYYARLCEMSVAPQKDASHVRILGALGERMRK